MANKVCLITGVGPGTGRALVRQFCKEYRVAMIARNEERLAGLEGELINTKGYPCYLSDSDQLESTIQRIRE